MDGFRALAHVGEHETKLVSRPGNVYKTFTELACAMHIDPGFPLPKSHENAMRKESNINPLSHVASTSRRASRSRSAVTAARSIQPCER
jgi:hypothetical protein